MHRLNVLKAIPLLFGFAAIFFGCASSDQVADTDFGMTAEAVPEGILMTFSHIPSDASHLWISVLSLEDSGGSGNQRTASASFAGITNTSALNWVHSTQQLETIKQTGKVVFPFVQAGQTYHFLATVYNQQDRAQSLGDDHFRPLQASAECIAEGGIYFDRDSVTLTLDDAHAVMALTSEPAFSSEVMFASQKYSFGVTIVVDKNRSVSVADHHIPEGLSPDGLSWTFEPEMSVNLMEHNDWIESGADYTAWAEVRAEIIHDGILWSVEIAKTPNFTFSL